MDPLTLALITAASQWAYKTFKDSGKSSSNSSYDSILESLKKEQRSSSVSSISPVSNLNSSAISQPEIKKTSDTRMCQQEIKLSDNNKIKAE